MAEVKKKKSELNYDDEMAWKEREKAIEEEARITHKKAYTRDTQRLSFGRFYGEGNAYKNATTEDKYSEVEDYTEKSDKFLKASAKFQEIFGYTPGTRMLKGMPNPNEKD